MGGNSNSVLYVWGGRLPLVACQHTRPRPLLFLLQPNDSTAAMALRCGLLGLKSVAHLQRGYTPREPPLYFRVGNYPTHKDAGTRGPIGKHTNKKHL